MVKDFSNADIGKMYREEYAQALGSDNDPALGVIAGTVGLDLGSGLKVLVDDSALTGIHRVEFNLAT